MNYKKVDDRTNLVEHLEAQTEVHASGTDAERLEVAEPVAAAGLPAVAAANLVNGFNIIQLNTNIHPRL